MVAFSRIERLRIGIGKIEKADDALWRGGSRAMVTDMWLPLLARGTIFPDMTKS